MRLIRPNNGFAAGNMGYLGARLQDEPPTTKKFTLSYSAYFRDHLRVSTKITLICFYVTLKMNNPTRKCDECLLDACRV